MQADRLPGISFVLRARNEEKYVRRAITSLESITVPHEIVVILHCCTDGTRDIVEELQREGKQDIQIHTIDTPMSRAGYETVVTPRWHESSFCRYSQWCFEQARYNWMFKWDADFEASPALVDFLNTRLDLATRTPIRYTVHCHVGDAINYEQYLHNCLLRFGKHVFWEVPVFTYESTVIDLGSEAHINTIPCTVLKDYWRKPAWFLPDKDPELCKRYAVLVDRYGPEPVGCARAQCPDGDGIYHALKRDAAQLEADHGIQIFE